MAWGASDALDVRTAYIDSVVDARRNKLRHDQPDRHNAHNEEQKRQSK